MTDPLLDPFRAKMTETLLRSIVGRTMFCPVSGRTLDFRTCVVFVDNDGDPSQVLSQEGWATLVSATEKHTGLDAAEVLAGQGVFLDRSSVKA
jgi:hypothetical protein